MTIQIRHRQGKELLCQLANSNIAIQALYYFSRTQNALHTTKSRKQANIDMKTAWRAACSLAIQTPRQQ
jgi:hypothetical protein